MNLAYLLHSGMKLWLQWCMFETDVLLLHWIMQCLMSCGMDASLMSLIFEFGIVLFMSISRRTSTRLWVLIMTSVSLLGILRAIRPGSSTTSLPSVLSFQSALISINDISLLNPRLYLHHLWPPCCPLPPICFQFSQMMRTRLVLSLEGASQLFLSFQLQLQLSLPHHLHCLQHYSLTLTLLLLHLMAYLMDL